MWTTGQLNLGILDAVENFFYDERLKSSLEGGVDERIVIIDIDEASIAAIGRFPWRRNHFADMTNQLIDHYNVRVLGWDVVFAEADANSSFGLLEELAVTPWVEENFDLADWVFTKMESSEPDHEFARALDNDRIVLGYTLHGGSVSENLVSVGTLPKPTIPKSALTGIDLNFMSANGYTANAEVFAKLTQAEAGFFNNSLNDSDGVIRRVPLLQQYNGDLYQSLALAVARKALGNPPIDLLFDDGAAGVYNGQTLKQLEIGESKVWVDENVAMRVPYRGPYKSFPYISAIDVIEGRVPKERLENTIALVGTSAVGLVDLRSTPVGKNYAGVEVHANIVAGLLDSHSKFKPQWIDGAQFWWLVTIALLMVFILPRVGPGSAFALLLLLMAGNITVSFWAWNEHNLVLPLASPVLYCLVQFLMQMSYGYAIESRRKNRLSKVFGQYIPPELVSDLDSSDEALTLEGDSREMTVLFSDVRGFTTISEGLSPRELTQLMNEFLTPITRVIHAHKGTIDKYMGDAVMAFWGAPVSDPNHAKNSLLAGMEMCEQMRELGPVFKAKGWPEIKIGVGLNTGTMNVGNMGSEFRMAYTVLGDAVNLGARLESLTKQYGVDIMVSEFTLASVPSFAFRYLDMVRVKGKDEPVKIFEPMGEMGALSDDQHHALAMWDMAISAYRGQKWKDAKQLIGELLQDDCERMIYRIYLERIEHFATNPPDSDWDGVYTHTSK
jgi:adenylate cyclase